jgi:pSer/pThr/pTyr-binding forkhead associated (FHA) protein
VTTCPQCGRDIPDDLADGARFCPFCGARIHRPVADLVDSTTTFSLPSHHAETAAAASGGDEAAEGQESLDSESKAAVDALPTGSAMLVVQRGPNAGSRFLLDNDLVTTGRHPDSDVFLDDVTVSRRHAEFRRSADGFVVRDVGSLNGTYVNRDRVDEVTLGNGDEVQVGKYRLVYYAATEAPASGASPA